MLGGGDFEESRQLAYGGCRVTARQLEPQLVRAHGAPSLCGAEHDLVTERDKLLGDAHPVRTA